MISSNNSRGINWVIHSSPMVSCKSPSRERKISLKFFCPKFLCTPWGHGRPRVRVMHVRTHMLVFQGFEGVPEVFERDVCTNDPGTYVRGIPTPKTFCLDCFFTFLTQGLLLKQLCLQNCLRVRLEVPPGYVKRGSYQKGVLTYHRAPNPPEFAQSRLSRVKALSSPARCTNLGVFFCSYMAGHCPASS